MPEKTSNGKELLAEHIPVAAVETIWQWMGEYHIHLCIVNNRKTKLGDFRAANNGYPHKITVNQGLNKYSFLITLVHELAHAAIWEGYKNKVQAHGKTWKAIYSGHMNHFMSETVFPADILLVLQHHFTNPKAMGSTDLALQRVLMKYDDAIPQVLLEQLPEESIFAISTGRTFQKKEKLRKRYRCICMNNKKTYLFHPLTKIIPIQ